MNIPTNPAEQQQDIFVPENDFDFGKYQKHIRNARIILFVLAAFQVFSIFLMGEQEEGAKVLITGTVIGIAIVFTGIGFWTKYQPLPALITGLTLYLILLAVTGYFNPATIFQGIILKLVVIVLLVLGVKNAKDLQDVKRNF